MQYLSHHGRAPSPKPSTSTASPNKLEVTKPSRTYGNISNFPIENSPRSSSSSGLRLAYPHTAETSPKTRQYLIDIVNMPEIPRKRHRIVADDTDTPVEKNLKRTISCERKNLKNKRSQISQLQKKLKVVKKTLNEKSDVENVLKNVDYSSNYFESDKNANIT